MREKPSSRRPQPLPERSVRSRDEPDWDYSFGAVPSSIERDRSSTLYYNNDSIVAPPRHSLQSSEYATVNRARRNPTQARTTTRQLTSLEVLCASHDCSIAQEPESLYYRTITNGRTPNSRPRPGGGAIKRQKQRRPSTPPTSPVAQHRTMPRHEEQTTPTNIRRIRQETNHIKIAMEESLVSSGLSKRVRSSSGRRKSSFQEHNDTGLPFSEITIQRQDEQSELTSCAALGPSSPRQEKSSKNLLDQAESHKTKSSKSEKKSKREKHKDGDIPVPVIVIERQDNDLPGCRLPSFSIPRVNIPRVESMQPSVVDDLLLEESSLSGDDDDDDDIVEKAAASSPNQDETADDPILETKPPASDSFIIQDEESLPLGCQMPSFSSPLERRSSPPSDSVPTTHMTSSMSNDDREDGTSPMNTSASTNEIVGELLDLQDQLDALRMTTPGLSKEALVDAAFKAKHEELVDFPHLDEELIDGLSFQAFESQRDAPTTTTSAANDKSSVFSAFVNALHQNKVPVMEESFIDEGVRVRRFDAEAGNSPTTPDSSFSISIQQVDATPEKAKKSKTTRSSRDEQESRSTSGRDAPEPTSPSEAVVVKKKQGSKKKRTKSKSPLVSPESPTTLKTSKSRVVPDSPRQRRGGLSKANSFSIRRTLASVRAKPSTTRSLDDDDEEMNIAPTKSVRFSKKLVTSVHHRPKTLPHEMEALYFSTEELEELERDREERIYEEQFECVAGQDDRFVSVTYPVRRVENAPPPSESDYAEQLPPPSQSVHPRRRRNNVEELEPSPPELVDVSGSWSSASELEVDQQGQTVEI